MKIIKKSLYIIITIFIIIGVLFLNEFLKEYKYLFYSSGTNKQAFLNSTWEMSPPEIQRANDTNLIYPETDWLREFPIFSHYPKILNPNCYKTLIQNNLNIWGYDCNVNYYFFDERLFSYSLEFEIGRAALNKTTNKITSLISNKHGDYIEKHQDQYLKHFIWKTEDMTVEFKAFDSKNDLTIWITYEYLPMLQKINEISEKEENQLFN